MSIVFAVQNTPKGLCRLKAALISWACYAARYAVYVSQRSTLFPLELLTMESISPERVRCNVHVLVHDLVMFHFTMYQDKHFFTLLLECGICLFLGVWGTFINIPSTMFFIFSVVGMWSQMFNLCLSNWEHRVRNTANQTVFSCFQNIAGTPNLLRTS